MEILFYTIIAAVFVYLFAGAFFTLISGDNNVEEEVCDGGDDLPHTETHLTYTVRDTEVRQEGSEECTQFIGYRERLGCGLGTTVAEETSWPEEEEIVYQTPAYARAICSQALSILADDEPSDPPQQEEVNSTGDDDD